MNTGRRSRNPTSAAVSAEDQPQRHRNLAGTRWNPRRSMRATCCGWCSAHTAALREESSRRARILQSCSKERRSRNGSSLGHNCRAGDFPWSVPGRSVLVPPGPKARRRRQLSGDLMIAGATANFSRRTRILKHCSTEKTTKLTTDGCSRNGDCVKRMQTFVFLCVHHVSVVSFGVSFA